MRFVPLDQASGESRLALVRIWRGKTQAEVAEAIGISERTYRRLEAGQYVNPPLRYLTNAALALGVKLRHVIDPDWEKWWSLDPNETAPPPRDQWMPGWRQKEKPPFVDEVPEEGELF